MLEIQGEKDKQYEKLSKDLKEHKPNYSNFIKKSIPKTMNNIKKAKKRYRRSRHSDEDIQVRIKRFNLEAVSEEFIILKAIDEVKKEEKEAVIKFYKSYIETADKQKELLEKLKGIDDSVKDNKAIKTEKFKGTNDYLNQLQLNDSNNLIVDLSKKGKDSTIPKALVEESLLKEFQRFYKEIDQEIWDIESGPKLYLCQTVFIGLAFVTGDTPCLNKVRSLKENRETLQKSVDFSALIKLLKDMKRKTPSFKIAYDQNQRKLT